jgi:glycosyltransferase involved in cell wall biosynthesis
LTYKIQMIAPTSFFADTGCHVRILEEIWSLQEAGHEVVVCTYHTGDQVEGVNIKRSLDVPWLKRVQVGSSRHKLYFDAMLSFKAAWVAWRFKPDIIHAHLHEGALIGFQIKWLLRRGKAPLIFDFQGSLTGEMQDHHFLRKNGPFYKPTLFLEKWINRLADKIITSSQNATEVLKQNFQISPAKITTIGDRVNLERFHPARTPADLEEVTRLKEILGIPADRKVVVYLGLLAPYQGTDLILQAARMLKTEMPEAFFVIMGYPGVDSYAREAEQLGLQGRVIFPGRIPFEDAPRYLRIGDVAITPKMSATEGAGKIPIYMATGLPVVTFDTPVSQEFMGDLGLYAEFGSARALADKLKEVLSDEPRRQQLGQALRAKAEADLGREFTLTQLEAVYAEALHLNRSGEIELGVAADSGHDPDLAAGSSSEDASGNPFDLPEIANERPTRPPRIRPEQL